MSRTTSRRYGGRRTCRRPWLPTMRPRRRLAKRNASRPDQVGGRLRPAVEGGFAHPLRSLSDLPTPRDLNVRRAATLTRRAEPTLIPPTLAHSPGGLTHATDLTIRAERAHAIDTTYPTVRLIKDMTHTTRGLTYVDRPRLTRLTHLPPLTHRTRLTRLRPPTAQLSD